MTVILLFLVDESTFTTLEPVPFDLCDNINDSHSSPPPLVIDTAEDIVSSQFNISNRSIRNQSNENYNPSRTPLTNNRTNKNSNNVTNSLFNKDPSFNIAQKEVSMNNNTTSAVVNIRFKKKSVLSFKICALF